jgi:D-alanyl-D-alanine carboxypeptidase/D-alanyl-D-alanine-endopeptidase (penicillin-binding protein 4)
MRPRLLIGVTVSGALALGLMAAPSAASTVDNRIALRVEAAVRAPALGADVTVHVRHVRNDSTVVQRRSKELQVPASTMKVVTAATSLATLGANHRFPTRVVAGATAQRIVLVGGGDPLLTRAQLSTLAARAARQLRARGISAVTVDVDDFAFPRPTDAVGWEPGDRPTYAAAVRPLGFLGEYSNDTVATAWSAFMGSLRSRGMEVRAGERVVSSTSSQRIADIRPNTLRRAVDVMLRVSENNVAEVLFRQVALARGYPATWSSASRAAGEVLRELGLETWRLRLVDGSGLSFDNRLSAAALTELLDLSMEDRRLAALIAGLPVAGQSGTLIRRFAAPPASCARGHVAAKTGSLTGVSTLAGVTRGSDGQWRSFAILVNKRPPSYPWASTSLAIDTLAAVVRGCA